MELTRNWKFTVEIDGEEIGIMSVEGLGGSWILSRPPVRLVRTFVKDDAFFIKWANSQSKKTVVVTVSDWFTVTLADAVPTDHRFSVLDAGGNEILREMVVLDYDRCSIKSIDSAVESLVEPFVSESMSTAAATFVTQTEAIR